MDDDVVEAMALCKALGVQVRVRGTDESPKVVFTDAKTLKLVGTIEFNARMKRYKRSEKL